MARLYANENFPQPVVEHLRRLGHDVLTMHEAGKSGQRVLDPEVLALATAQNRAVLSLNRKHFIHLHAAQPGHAGIVVCTFDPDFEGQAQRIDEQIEGLELSGRLLRVNRPMAPAQPR